MAKRVKPGDVVEIPTSDGPGYGQYLGEHARLGGCLWLTRGIRATPLSDTDEIDWADGYHVFYPVRSAVNRGLVTVVGQRPLDGRAVPGDLRRPGARARDGKLLTWIVAQGDSEYVCEDLSVEEKRIPIGVIWNHEMLVQRLTGGWTPEEAE